MNGWRALADDIMTYLIGRGMRPTPHRYAIVCYLADRGVLDPNVVAIPVGEGSASVNRALLRRMTGVLTREGIVEQTETGAHPIYHLRPVEAWGH